MLRESRNADGIELPAHSSRIRTLHQSLPVWDRVRLLLQLFTEHASSVEARTQVRLARLKADRAVLREVVHRETSGERMGYGAGGRHAWRGVLETVQREVSAVQRRQRRHARSQSERRRQRRRSGVLTVGLAGYTNAGKSTLFRALSGKEVLVEDRLFSTLETTIGRMTASPRVLMVDTIGFIDRIPADLLDAFNATLTESLECDLLLIVLDSSDDRDEMERKIATCRRDLLDRMDDDSMVRIGLVLTKTGLTDSLSSARSIAEESGFILMGEVDSLNGVGLIELTTSILEVLVGEAQELLVTEQEDGPSLGRILHDVHECSLVESTSVIDGVHNVSARLSNEDLQRLLNRYPNSIRRRNELD